MKQGFAKFEDKRNSGCRAKFKTDHPLEIVPVGGPCSSFGGIYWPSKGISEWEGDTDCSSLGWSCSRIMASLKTSGASTDAETKATATAAFSFYNISRAKSEIAEKLKAWPTAEEWSKICQGDTACVEELTRYLEEVKKWRDPSADGSRQQLKPAVAAAPLATATSSSSAGVPTATTTATSTAGVEEADPGPTDPKPPGESSADEPSADEPPAVEPSAGKEDTSEPAFPESALQQEAPQVLPSDQDIESRLVIGEGLPLVW